MPVTQQLLDEFTKLIDDYSTQSKFKVLPSLRADRNLQENVALLDGLLKLAHSDNEKLTNQTIIFALVDYIADKKPSDPVFYECVVRFRNNYRTIADSVYSKWDLMHLEPIPGADAVYIPALLITTMRAQNVTHASEKLAYERQLETAYQEIATLKSTVVALKIKESELDQLKIKFQELQTVNAQLHQAGIAFIGLDRILAPSQSNDAPPALPVETVTIQASNAPPPPPPPPMPLAGPVSAPENAVRFRPDVKALPGRSDLMAQLKNRLNLLAAKNEPMGTQDTQPNSSALPQALPIPIPAPRKGIKRNPPTLPQEVLPAIKDLITRSPISAPINEPTVQIQPEIPVSRPISTSFFQPIATLDSGPTPVINAVPKQKPKPNSLALYQAAQEADPALSFINAIGKVINTRRERIASSESDSEDETWETISLA